MTVEPIDRAKPRKPSNDTVPHVVRAINAVTKEIAKDGISKDRKNASQGYSFRGIDDVLNVLASIITTNELVIIPHMRSREQVERTTAKGGVLFYVTVEADYTFISAQDGTEHTVGPFYGEAMDSADKATNKAMSAAYKYMAIQTFCIPTRGDNDADETTHEIVAQRPISRAELAKLQELVDATETDIELFCKYLKVNALASLTSPDGFARAHTALLAKQKQREVAP